MARDARLPLGFVPNAGQLDQRVQFHAQGSGYGLYVTPEKIVVVFVPWHGRRDPAVVPAASAPLTGGGMALALRFLRSNRNVTIEPQSPLPGTVSYFIGNDPARWRSGLSRYGELVYRDLWPAIDMRLRSDEGRFKYEFVVRPGGRVEDIGLTYDGVSGVSIDSGGQLRIETPLGEWLDERPRSYQLNSRRRTPIESEWLLTKQVSRLKYGFRVADYDRSLPLVVDPGLAYSSYLGGSAFDAGTDIAVDALSNAYVTGVSLSPDFPMTPGTFTTPVGSVFVSKLDRSGKLVYLALFGGGTRQDKGEAIVVDGNGSAFLSGTALSPDFPTTPGAYDSTLNGFDDAFVAKLNPSGSALVYSTFLGGADEDLGFGIAIDPNGSAFVTGSTNSDDFPMSEAAFDTLRNGNWAGFVAKLSPDGSALAYSSYLEQGYDQSTAAAVAVSSNGEANVAGDGGGDAMVARVKADGSGLVYKYDLGGGSDDFARGIALDSEGNAVVVGTTASADFPITPDALDRTFAAPRDAFIAKLDPTGSILFSTFLGGSAAENAQGVVLDSKGQILLAGFTGSADFPTTAGAHDRTINGESDAFVVRLDASGSHLLYSTFLGGGGSDAAFAIAIDSAGEPHISGGTESLDFPTTRGAFDRDYNGGFSDAFVAKLTTAPASCAGSPGTIVGTESDDVLVGTGGDDVIVGAGGNDIIEGRLGDDVICGGPGQDTIDAGGGLDQVFGEAGGDRVMGGAGADVLDGGDGDDLLRGEAGNDVLQGGAGDDTLNGGSGYDTCRTGSGDRNATAECERF